ncbi:hypothetical protein QW131_30080 [Roseibium salinum]|nr:hypothetical protein [Roseibium salinum]
MTSGRLRSKSKNPEEAECEQECGDDISERLEQRGVKPRGDNHLCRGCKGTQRLGIPVLPALPPDDPEQCQIHDP